MYRTCIIDVEYINSKISVLKFMFPKKIISRLYFEGNFRQKNESEVWVFLGGK